MGAIVPWSALCAVIEPHYLRAGNGRPPIRLERMLRIHFIQHWFNLADLACEEALYDSASLRRFAGIDLGAEPVPDATTMLRFRRLLNDNKLGEALFARVGKELQARGIQVNTGTIVDATIIGAPSSTKNADKARDPDMHLADMFDDKEETLQMSTDAMILKAIAKGALEQIGEVVTAKNFDEAEKAFAKGS